MSPAPVPLFTTATAVQGPIGGVRAAAVLGRRPHRYLGYHRAVLAFYALATLLLTWPLLRYCVSYVPGDGIDDPALIWNLWWIKYRLVDQIRLDIFHVEWMFHPIDINLAFYTLTPLNGLLSVPLQVGMNLVIANNLILWSSFVLGGYGAYLLALDNLSLSWAPAESKRVNRGAWRHIRVAAAVWAGIVYAFASSKFFYAALGQVNIASSQWIPFCVLYILRLARGHTWRSTRRSALWAGAFLVLQAWAELTYASFLLLFFALVAAWRLFKLPARGSDAGQRWSRLPSGQKGDALRFWQGVALGGRRLCGGNFAVSGGDAARLAQ